VEDHLICTYYSNLSDVIRDGLRKILAEYRRKKEVEIAATLYKEENITLREAAAIMDAPVRKTLEELGGRGVYLRYGMEEPGRGSWMITVSDSAPLIHFGAIKRLDLLRSMYGQIFITEVVHREVVTEGIALGKTDANLFGKGDWGLG
jgi:predicted HTH domain antitoxin